MYTKSTTQLMASLQESVVDWKVFAAWVETEGSINSTIDFDQNPRTGKYFVHIVRAILIPQSERAPLEALQLFLTRNEVYSKLRLLKPSKTSLTKNPYYRLEIERMEDIDKVVEHIKAYLITEKARNQVGFYLHVRHMTADQVRDEFLQSWLDSHKNKKRRGKKGQKYVY